MKRVSVFSWTFIVGAIALSASASISAGQPIQPRGSQPSLETMEHHWQSVINERDATRRQVLIEEHRRMMGEAHKADKVKTTPARSSEMMQDSVHRDLKHAIEMHSIMLDMMK